MAAAVVGHAARVRSLRKVLVSQEMYRCASIVDLSDRLLIAAIVERERGHHGITRTCTALALDVKRKVDIVASSTFQDGVGGWGCHVDLSRVVRWGIKRAYEQIGMGLRAFQVFLPVHPVSKHQVLCRSGIVVEIASLALKGFLDELLYALTTVLEAVTIIKHPILILCTDVIVAQILFSFSCHIYSKFSLLLTVIPAFIVIPALIVFPTSRAETTSDCLPHNLPHVADIGY